MAAPKVDQRSRKDIVDQTDALLQQLYPHWRANEGNAGNALVNVFARYAEIIIERLNQAPNKRFIAYLNMLGVKPRPPRPARAPLQFLLAEGAQKPAQVPQMTPVATKTGEPVVFETEQALTVVPAQLTHCITYDVVRDHYTHHRTGVKAATFEGQQLIEHCLYLGDTQLLATQQPGYVAVRVTFADTSIQQDMTQLLALAVLDWRIEQKAAMVSIGSSTDLGRLLEPRLFTTSPNVSQLRVVSGADTLQGHLTVGDHILIPGIGAAQVKQVAADGTTINIDQSVTIDHPGLVVARIDARHGNGSLSMTSASPPTLQCSVAAFSAGDLDQQLVIVGAGMCRITQVVDASTIEVDRDLALPAGHAVAYLRVRDITLTGQCHTNNSTSREIHGTATRFTDQLRIGDQVRLEGQSQSLTVMAITNQTRFTADQAVKIAAPGVKAIRTVKSVDVLSPAALPCLQASKLNNIKSNWLALQTLQPLTEDVNLAQVDEVGVMPLLSQLLVADLGFIQNQPLDFSKGGFYVFSEKPALDMAFYFSSQEALSKAGSRITIEFDVTFPITSTLSPTVTLIYEYWNGTEWAEMARTSESSVPSNKVNFTDTSKAFTRTSASGHVISFICPTITERKINGKDGYWLRVRIFSGNYGEDGKLVLRAGHSTPPTLQDWNYQPATYKPPYITHWLIRYEYAEFQMPTCVTTYNRFQFRDVSSDIQAGTAVPLFEVDDVKDAGWYLGFDQEFQNQPVSLLVNAVENIHFANPTVAWQYWDGSQWQALAVKDETLNLTQAGIVQFIGPAVFPSRTLFGQSRHWLRVQLRDGNSTLFAYRAVNMNTVWGRHATTLNNELLGSSNGKPRQIFTLSKSPVLEHQVIEVREPEQPSDAELKALKQTATDSVSVVRDDAGRVTEVWVRWQEVDHFYASSPHSRHYVIDRTDGTITFGDDKQGMIPPAGRNNIRARTYQFGGGSKGNVKASTLVGLKRTIPLIDQVTNPMSAAGGSDSETIDRVQARGPNSLRHRYRAVSYEDYEQLAKEASIEVARALAIPASADVNASKGKVGLLIVPESAAPLPYPSPGLFTLVRQYMTQHQAVVAQLYLTGPRYVVISVSAEVVPIDIQQAEAIRQRVIASLTAYFHPLTGGLQGSGWEFGRNARLSEVAALLERTDGVDYVKKIALSGSIGGVDRTNPSGTMVEVIKHKGELVASGTHTITIAMN